MEEPLISKSVLATINITDITTTKSNNIDNDCEYSQYINYIMSLRCEKKCFSLGELEKEVFKFETLKEDSYQLSFANAVQTSFQNGDGKVFCQILAHTCSSDLYLTFSHSRSTFEDRFKLLRIEGSMEKESTEIITRSSSKDIDSSYLTQSWVNSNSNSSDTSSSSSHYAEGKCSADLVTLHLKTHMPFVIFECKSNGDTSSLQKGISQLLSYGLSLRHKKQLKYDIKLVLILPGYWFISSLPPFGTELPTIVFSRYDVMEYDENHQYYVNRKAYLGFLNNLRQHFELLKKLGFN